MAEKWRRCGSCRKVRPIEDFADEETSCHVCLSAATRPGAGRRAAAASPGGLGGGDGRVHTATTTPVRDLAGRGDPEVRARRARVRALDRLVEWHTEDFELLLAEERRAERL